MKKIIYGLSSAGLLALPLISQAQQGFAPDGGGFGDLLRNFLLFTNQVLIPFILGIAFLFFVWGVFLYFIAGGANEEKQGKGKSLIIYATLGFVIIIIFWGVINLLANATGFDNDNLRNIPQVEITP